MKKISVNEDEKNKRFFSKKKTLMEYLRAQKKVSLAFVPTMGGLHEGHLSLIRAAYKHSSCVVISLFVNPRQFAAGEDFERYPRHLNQDLKALSVLDLFNSGFN